MPDDVIAIVLAGGRSRRLGPLVGPGGKAAPEIEGESLVGRACRTLAAEVDHVIVVAARGQPLPVLPTRVAVIRDAEPFAGPLVAVHAGLAHAGVEPAVALLVACDMPSLEPAVLRRVIEAAREPGVCWAVPVVGGHPQVLLSAISTGLEPALGTAIKAGQTSLQAVLKTVGRDEPAAVRWISEAELAAIDPTFSSFAEIDTAADLDRLRRSPRPRA
jgi:molybdopterin-guanine dinucleotide biosynthesis protein A